MSRLPLPDAPDRETARQKIRAAQMCGMDPADVVGYLCVAIRQDGSAELASNGGPDMIAGVCRTLAGMADNGDLPAAVPGQDQAEPPEQN